MARAYSLDLRKRVVEAIDAGPSTRAAVFDRDFDVWRVVSRLAFERQAGARPAGKAEAFKAGRARNVHSGLGGYR
jgi:hypothetical protein